MEYECRVCRENVEENGCWCDRCNSWIHNRSKCSGLSKADFDALTKLKSPCVKYFCPLCQKDVEEGGDVDGKSCALEAKMDIVLQHLKKKDQEERELESKIEKMIERKVSEHAHEKDERAKRENNLVISGKEESRKESEEEQKIDDIEIATAVLRDAIGQDEIKNNMTVLNVLRVGKKGPNPLVWISIL